MTPSFTPSRPSQAAIAAALAAASLHDGTGFDAVFIATPMHLHVPQTIAALDRGIHVLCEVTAATSIEQCRELAAACARNSAVYMLGENVNFMREIMAVRGMVEQGNAAWEL